LVAAVFGAAIFVVVGVVRGTVRGFDFGGPGVVLCHVACGVVGVLLFGFVGESAGFEKGAEVVAADCGGEEEEDAAGEDFLVETLGKECMMASGWRMG
jgi:hypothetical protein